MVKKLLALILISSIFSLNAFKQEDLDQLKNPEQIYFHNLDLCGANLSDYNLSNKTFEKTLFNGVIFDETIFFNSTFIKCNFVDTIFNTSIIVNAKFYLCNMQKVYMTLEMFNTATFDTKSPEGIIFIN